MCGSRIEIIECLGDAQIGVGVEIIGKFIALVTQVGLDLEINIESVIELAVAQLASEFARHFVVGEIRNVADHACYAQALRRPRIVLVIVPAVKIGVGADRLARDFIERDILRGQVWRAGNHQRVADALGELDGPRQRLHRTEAPAHDCSKTADAKLVGKPRLGCHPIFDGDDRKISTPRAPGSRVHALGPG